MKIIITESQYRKILNEVDSDICDIFSNQTNIPDYDSVLFNTEKIDRDLIGQVIYMSPEEYFERCAQLGDTSVEDQYRYGSTNNTIKSLTKKVKEGVLLDLPYIDYDMWTQEGRHRVMIAKNMGCKLIPIAIFLLKGQTDPFQEITDRLSFDVNDYKDLKQNNGKYYVKYNKKDWYDFIGAITSNSELFEVLLHLINYQNHTLRKNYPKSEYEINDIIINGHDDNLHNFFVKGIVSVMDDTDLEDYEISDLNMFVEKLKKKSLEGLLEYLDIILYRHHNHPFCEYVKKMFNDVLFYMSIHGNIDYMRYLKKGFNIEIDENTYKIYIDKNIISDISYSDSMKKNLIKIGGIYDESNGLYIPSKINKIDVSYLKEYITKFPFL